MAGYNVNSDNRVADMLIGVKQHLRHCKKCGDAIRVSDLGVLCADMTKTLLTLAIQYDHVIPRRIKARRSDHTVFYSCPDLSRHGKSYVLTAEPLVATGVQEGLF